MANTTNMPVNSIYEPDCVTEVQVGNTTLVAYGFLNPDATETAIYKVLRVLMADFENTSEAKTD